VDRLQPCRYQVFQTVADATLDAALPASERPLLAVMWS